MNLGLSLMNVMLLQLMQVLPDRKPHIRNIECKEGIKMLQYRSINYNIKRRKADRAKKAAKKVVRKKPEKKRQKK